MKKFKEFYKAVTNPETHADWKVWWKSGELVRKVDWDTRDKLIKMSHEAYHMHPQPGWGSPCQIFSFGDCWFQMDGGPVFNVCPLSRSDYELFHDKELYRHSTLTKITK